MTGKAGSIERGALFEAARQRGIRLTKRQIWRWQQDGLIEPARLEYGQGRGARSFYAGDTLERAIIITQALDRQRDLDYARLAVWRAGYPIDVRDLFERGVEAVRQLGTIITADRAAVNADDDSHITLDERADLDWSGAPIMRTLHKRLSRWGVDYGALVFFASTAHVQDSADYDTLDERDRESMIIQALASLVGLPFTGNPYVLLGAVGQHLQPDNLEEVLSVSGDQVLRRSDQVLHNLIGLINGVINAVRILRGQQTAIAIDLDAEPPEMQTFIVLAFHSMIYVGNLHDKLQRLMVLLES